MGGGREGVEHREKDRCTEIVRRRGGKEGRKWKGWEGGEGNEEG